MLDKEGILLFHVNDGSVMLAQIWLEQGDLKLTSGVWKVSRQSLCDFSLIFQAAVDALHLEPYIRDDGADITFLLPS